MSHDPHQPPPPGAPPWQGPPVPPVPGTPGGQPWGGQPWGWRPGREPPPPPPAGGSVRTGPLPLHPMGLADVLDGAFKLLKANARTVLVVAAVFVVPVQLLAALAQRGVLGGVGLLDVLDDPSLAETAAESGGAGGDVVLGSIATVAGVVVLPFLAGAVAHVVFRSYVGEEPTAREALAATARRAWALFSSWLVVHLLELVPFLATLAVVVVAVGAVGPPGFVLLVVGVLPAGAAALAVMGLSVATAPAVAVERLGPVAGVRRSWRLMWPRFWPVLGIALLAGFVATVVANVLSFAPTTLAVAVGMQWGWVLVAAGGIAAQLVAEPVVAIVATLLYVDGRIRREGLDLAIMAGDLSAGADRGPRARR